MSFITPCIPDAVAQAPVTPGSDGKDSAPKRLVCKYGKCNNLTPEPAGLARRSVRRKLRAELQASEEERARGVRGYTIEEVTARMREAVRRVEAKTDKA